ncbi:tRNA (adenosine(37)-N6)-dimethylallyltransferase MiaA [Sphingomonas piscis]|uniref:tRNA dimethylallyltransferase n=1 Tax=Sphingomonas piscis TaxID=2714943 RepID=A0A6G7YS35_9SPHN|nr:tRNA (adenosine(37)-N6)-dimethylallyltransferase MiaA [Sphingomonas piscis]QIK79553.1 tRNA (adenosine(37)-N6)-dimethylallyltransferase MiaA [Sphingomonas piscis]
MAIASSNPPLVVIAGPTASGKSALAVRLAERIGGVLVNADSAQVYRNLPILSAAPSADELGRAEHRLYGVLDGETPCSAADWAEMAKREIGDVHHSGRTPILVGGTGLYLRTLLDGIAPVPAIDPAIRADVRSSDREVNLMRLRKLDPDAAERLQPNDTTRIARALEVVLSTGRTLKAWQQMREGGICEAIDLQAMILLPPRAWLYARCDQRFEHMVEAGALDEVAKLLDRRLDPDLPVMRAIGVPELGGLLRGELTRPEAIAAGQQGTRRYAKRQYTWFAHQPPASWRRITERVDDILDSLPADLSALT